MTAKSRPKADDTPPGGIHHPGMLRLNPSVVDYGIIAVYFLVVLGIGALARLSIKNDIDFFLSGRTLPAWITGLAFIAANLGALEILGQAANGAQYGIATVHFYWIGAVPAMLFLGLVMMPFYYGAKVRSVPEYLRLRFNDGTHAFNAATFAVGTVLIAGVNLFALALVMNLMIGWSLDLAILVAAGIVLVYITLGGLRSAIYNEVLQFFVIMASLIPLTIVGLHNVGGVSGLSDRIKTSTLGDAGLHAWEGLGIGSHNSLGADWIGVVLGLGFVLSFGYWTTNFAEVQRGLSARNMSAARRTPLIGAYPKIFLPLVVVVPGLIALVSIPGLGGSNADLAYNNAVPLLIGKFFPEGMLGVAVTGLLAAFMAGVAANVTAFNTVFTYDLWQSYVRKGRDADYYLRVGRRATVGGVLIAIGTAFIAKGYSNIMNYVQLLFSYFNAPLFATFIIGMFWRRATGWAGLAGLVAGTLGAFITHELYTWGSVHFGSAQSANFGGAIVAFIAAAVVMVAVSLATQPKPQEQLRGLVWGLPRDTPEDDFLRGDDAWYRSPWLLAGGALILLVVLNIIVI
jgi:solute:Na+ symporter, SSS family